MYSRLECTSIFIRQYKLLKPIPNTSGETAQTGSEPPDRTWRWRDLNWAKGYTVHCGSYPLASSILSGLENQSQSSGPFLGGTSEPPGELWQASHIQSSPLETDPVGLGVRGWGDLQHLNYTDESLN